MPDLIVSIVGKVLDIETEPVRALPVFAARRLAAPATASAYLS